MLVYTEQIHKRHYNIEYGTPNTTKHKLAVYSSKFVKTDQAIRSDQRFEWNGIKDTSSELCSNVIQTLTGLNL